MQRRQIGSKHRHFTNLAHSSTIDQCYGSGGNGIILADTDCLSGLADPDPYQFQPNVILNYIFSIKFNIEYTVLSKILKMMTPIWRWWERKCKLALLWIIPFPTCVKLGVGSASGSGSASKWKSDPDPIPIHKTAINNDSAAFFTWRNSWGWPRTCRGFSHSSGSRPDKTQTEFQYWLLDILWLLFLKSVRQINKYENK